MIGKEWVLTEATTPTATTPPAAPIRKMPHREDIHGLRGLGIVLVVAYHLWTNGRVSGGVDVFLIISAYLMTASMVRKGRAFRLITFLIQRFRRLVPQAAIVIAATLAVGWFFLPPSRQPVLLQHAQSSLFYVENWALIEQTINYTAVDPGRVSPFQHFWSLSVQGQVFVIWPLVFLLGVFVAAALKARLRIVLAVLFGGVTVASFAYAQWALHVDRSAAYFDTWARFWEFSLAGLLALVPRMTMPRRVAIPLGWAGLGAVLATGFLVGRDPFPGPATLFPALGAAAVMVADLHSTDRRDAAYWLSRRPVTFIANRAYALYLWHWPVYAYWMSLTEGHSDRLSVGGSVIVIGVSLILADLSTRLVERRFHRMEVLASKRGALSAIAVFVIIVVGLVEGMTRVLDSDVARTQAGNNPGARVLTPGATPEQASATPTSPSTTPVRGVAPGDSVIGGDWPHPAARCEGLDPMPPEFPTGNCYEVRPEGEPTRTVVLVGDSHSWQWSTVLVPMAVERGWHLIMPNHPRCRVTLENPWSDATCLEYSRAVVDYIVATRPDQVVTIGSRAQAVGPELEVETYAEAIRPVSDAGITVVNIRDNPRWTFAMPECVQRWGVNSPRCTAPLADKLGDAWPPPALAEQPNVRFLDFTDQICPSGLEGNCPGVIGNVYVYMDDNHLSRTYVLSLQDVFAERWDQVVG
ncbi:acyltransferase family protein [Ammonicoccus fulvus]|uniref:Acyltransferase family protein n=1 Tax=Ammonicoccus fulvus TaxID=3138240 RepID=A0ABZ3FJC8_9ACTN